MADRMRFQSRRPQQHQDVIYDFKAEIHGTGSRSCYYDMMDYINVRPKADV